MEEELGGVLTWVAVDPAGVGAAGAPGVGVVGPAAAGVGAVGPVAVGVGAVGQVLWAICSAALITSETLSTFESNA